MTTQQRRRDKRIQHILEMAITILATDGLEGLTIQRLASALDYTPGALYRYFASKDAILLGVQRLAIEGFVEVFESARQLGRAVADRAELVDPDAAVVELWALYHAYVAVAMEQPVRFALIASSMADPRQLVGDEDSAAILPPFLEALQPVITAIAAASPQSDPAEAFDRTVALMSGLMGVLTLRKVKRLAPVLLDVHRIARVHFRAMVLGFGVSSQQLDRTEALMDAAVGDTPILQLHPNQLLNLEALS